MYAAFSLLIVYYTVPSNLRVLANLPSNVIGFTSVIGCFGTILAPLAHMGIGAFYAYLHQREAPLSSEDGAIGGATSAAAARLVTGTFSTLTGLILTPILLRRFTEPALLQFSPSNFQFMIFPMLITAAGSVFGLCFGAVIAGAVGGLGGALGSVVINRRTRL